jgi:hypothetical protein
MLNPEKELAKGENGSAPTINIQTLESEEV